ncbi:MAG: succinate dehydrogenase cytochrome b subunit [Acidobacteriota bacterium]
MKYLLSLYRSALVKKAIMAVTGLVLFGFVLTHMAGNLKVFQGPEKINDYAHFLREFGQPVLPYGGLIWIFRVGLLVAVALHVLAATELTLMNRRARPVGYKGRKSVQMDYASRTMRYSGYLIFGYIVYHLLHLTVGSVHENFIPHDVYHNLVVGFSNPLIAVGYIVINVLLGFHLYHGLWSLFQTLGLSHPRWDAARRGFAVAFALVVTLGFVSVPLAVLTGVVS